MVTLDSLNAIATSYNGYRFRSRLEARWAVFFDTLGVKYRFESQGFKLPLVGWYLPDFYLPSQPGDGWWVEIKPEAPNSEEIQKCLWLAREMPSSRVLLLAGQPGPQEYSVCIFGAWPILVRRGLELGRLPGPLWLCPTCKELIVTNEDWGACDGDGKWVWPRCSTCDGLIEDPRQDILAAYSDARAARFETSLSEWDLAHQRRLDGGRYSEKQKYAGDGWIQHVRAECRELAEYRDEWDDPNSCVRCGRHISHKYETCYECRDRW